MEAILLIIFGTLVQYKMRLMNSFIAFCFIWQPGTAVGVFSNRFSLV